MCWKSSKLKIVGNVCTSHQHEDTGINSMITTFNTAVTETASEILGKHRQKKGKKKKKTRVTAECLDLCEKRRELRNEIFELEVSEKYKESEIEENLRKNNSKRAYRLVKDLTTCELQLSKIVQENASQKNERY